MMTGEQYIESIHSMKMRIFCMGEELETAVGHPILQPSLNSVKMKTPNTMSWPPPSPI